MSHPLLKDAFSVTESFSTTVRLFLYVGDVAYELADVGPFDVTLREPRVLLEGSDQAILDVCVDGRSERQKVRVSASNADSIVRYSATIEL